MMGSHVGRVGVPLRIVDRGIDVETLLLLALLSQPTLGGILSPFAPPFGSPLVTLLLLSSLLPRILR